MNSSAEKDMPTFISEMNHALERMYEDMAQAINGNIKSNYAIGRQNWIPLLRGTTAPGTFTYVNQSGTVLRQGLINDVWFDISWTATTATGNIYLELPYKAALVNNLPFVGVVQPSGFAFTGGTAVVINAISNTYRGEFWNTGSAFTTARQAVTASGRLIGHIRYMGVANEPA